VTCWSFNDISLPPEPRLPDSATLSWKIVASPVEQFCLPLWPSDDGVAN
jgi:hypothetical protein